MTNCSFTQQKLAFILWKSDWKSISLFSRFIELQEDIKKKVLRWRILRTLLPSAFTLIIARRCVQWTRWLFGPAPVDVQIQANAKCCAFVSVAIIKKEKSIQHNTYVCSCCCRCLSQRLKTVTCIICLGTSVLHSSASSVLCIDMVYLSDTIMNSRRATDIMFDHFTFDRNTIY